MLSTKMVKNAVVLLCAIAAANLVSGTQEAGQSKYPKYTTIDIMNGRVQRFESIRQIYDLSSLFHVTDLMSHEQVKIAVNPAVEVTKSIFWDWMCGPKVGEMYAKMKRKHFGFHLDFAMPKTVQKFMEALAFEIVGMCKPNLIAHTTNMGSHLSDSDMKSAVTLETRGAVLIDDSIDEASLANTDIFRVFVELLDMIKAGTEADDGTESLKGLKETTILHLRTMHKACNVIYRGFYVALLDTMIKLTRLGYDYPINGEMLSGLSTQFNTSPHVRRWLNIMLTCTALSVSPLFKSDMKVNPTNPGQSIDNHMLPSIPVKEELLVDQDKLSKMFSDSNASGKAANKIRDQIYSRLAGPNMSITEKIIKNEKKFWRNFIFFIDSKF